MFSGCQHTRRPGPEQTAVKYHTGPLVFCHRGETFSPLKRANPSDLPHAVIELFLISCFFFNFYYNYHLGFVVVLFFHWLTVNMKFHKNFFFFCLFPACFHREAPGQWQSLLCQPQHTDNTVGRSPDPRVRP